jgi:hypothetical protein
MTGNIFSIKQLFAAVSIALALLFVCVAADAQVLPPRPISVFVNPAQPLSFGAFYQGALGGSVIVYANGARSVTGDVVGASLGFSFSPALFEVEGLPGTLVTILNGPDVTLTGSNGGSMLLHIGASAPGSPFIITTSPPSRAVITVGGTLTVGSPQSNPAGSYSGTFDITFIEQ